MRKSCLLSAGGCLIPKPHHLSAEPGDSNFTLRIECDSPTWHCTLVQWIVGADYWNIGDDGAATRQTRAASLAKAEVRTFVEKENTMVMKLELRTAILGACMLLAWVAASASAQEIPLV